MAYYLAQQVLHLCPRCYGTGWQEDNFSVRKSENDMLSSAYIYDTHKYYGNKYFDTSKNCYDCEGWGRLITTVLDEKRFKELTE